jgi:hypothetical protein
MSSLEIQATCIPQHTDISRQARFLHQRPQDVHSERLTITAERWLGLALNFIKHEMTQFAVIRIGILSNPA